jgi:putative membrane protein
MISAFVAYLHHLVAFSLVTTVLLQNILLRNKVDHKSINQLRMIDAIYGISAALILLIGLLRVYFFEKGSAYYFSSNSFILKMTFFILVGILSIFPTLRISKWSKQFNNDSHFVLELKNYQQVKIVKRMELFLLFFIPLFAIFMAKGIL